MNQLECVFEALKGYAASGDFPGFELKNHNSVGLESLRICGANETFNASEKPEVALYRWLREAAPHITTAAIGDAKSFTSDEIEKVSTAFAGKIAKAHSNLKAVKSVVTSLMQKLEETETKYLALDPVTASLVAKKPVTVDYKEMPFNQLAVCGNLTALTNYVVQAANIGAYNPADGNQLTVILARFPPAEMHHDKTKDVTLSKEKRAELITKITTAHKDIAVADVEEVVNTLTSKLELKVLANRIMRLVDEHDQTTASVELLSTISKVRGLASRIDKTLVEIGGTEDLHENIKFTDACTDLAAFVVQWHRNNTFKDTILFNNGMLNPDSKKVMDDNKLTTLALAQHVEFMLNGKVTSSLGVTTSSFLASKDYVARLATETSADNAALLTAKKKVIRHNAFLTVAAEWLFASAKDNTHIRDFTAYADKKAAAAAAKMSSVEDVLYSMVLEAKHNDGFEVMLHQRLTKAYEKSLTTGVEHTATSVALINAAVHTEIVTEFIMENFA